MDDFLIQNARLYQDSCCLPLLFLDVFLEHVSNCFPSHDSYAFTRYDEDNLHNWEFMRQRVQVIRRNFYGVDDILNYLRTHIDPRMEQENSHAIPQENVGGDLDMKEMIRMMEQRVSLIKRENAWQLELNNDYMDKVICCPYSSTCHMSTT